MDLIVTTERFCNPGETVIGNGFSTAPGGKGANQAVQAARLGANVTMVGKVGNDDFGRSLINSLENSGINTEYVKTVNKPTSIGNVQIQKNDKGTENRIIVYPGANFEWELSDVDFLKESICQYDMVILQNEIPQFINVAVAKMAKCANVPVMLNPAPSAELDSELIECLTYISPNEHEAQDMICDKSSNAFDIKEIVNAIHKIGVENVLVTLGKNGCAFSDKNHLEFSSSVDVAPVVDPTAAGDSFIGAFCRAISAGVDVSNALVFANCTAAITVSVMGAQTSLPYLEDVVSVMKKFGFNTDCLE
jgi:ribokinase